MQINFLENVVLVSVRKVRNNYVTILHNVPQGRTKALLAECKSKFGCCGNVDVENNKEIIKLQGDQTFNIEKNKETIFKGLEVKQGQAN